jgi:dTDP-4-amino-4,6-dideoxygalactose transaminase
MVYYPIPQDQLPVYKEKYPKNPVSDMLAGEVLSLPIWAELEKTTIEHIFQAVQKSV